MKFIDVILSVIKSLFSSWITKFKENNPSGFRVVGLVLVAISGLSVWIISNGIAPQFDHIIELVGYAAAGLAALFGINQLAAGSKAQVLSRVGDELKANAAHTRTILLSLLFVAGFVACVWLFAKKVPNVPEQATAITPTGESLTLPTPEMDPAKPLTSYVVTVLASKIDTVTSISTGGLPSVRVPQRLQYSLVFFPVTMDHVPTIEDFSIIKPRDGYKLERIVNIQLYPNK